MKNIDWQEFLRTHSFAATLPDLDQGNWKFIDLSKENPHIRKLNYHNPAELDKFIKNEKPEQGEYAIGGYGEERIWYARSDTFGKENEEARTIHIGIDIWCEAETPVFSPEDAIIHSFHDHDEAGNYGPVIILQHDVNDFSFFTLYGHLSKESLSHISEGDKIKKGQHFASIGHLHENGQWPPHLHFQVMKEMFGNKGDFPGVCKKSEKEFYLNTCPDPMWLLSNY